MMATATREASPAHLLLKIESFSLLDKCGVDKYETPEFVSGKFKWRLIIYPNGHGTEKAGDYVSVYLAISGTNTFHKSWEVNAVFSIFILNQISGNYLYTPGHTRRFFALKTEWGFPNFVCKKDLMTPSKGYLINDSCLFGAEVFVHDNKVVTQCLSLKNVEVPYKHAFKISGFSTFNGVWYSEEFTAGGCKWKIVLYSNEKSADETGPNVSIYLRYVASDGNMLAQSDERVKAWFSICLKNQLASDKNHKKSGSHWFDASCISRGWASFIPTAKLSDGFIMKDTCHLEIEIFVQAVAR